jgi:hypothetical protein
VGEEEGGDAGVGEEEDDEQEVDNDGSEGEMQVDGGIANAPDDLGKIPLILLSVITLLADSRVRVNQFDLQCGLVCFVDDMLGILDGPVVKLVNYSSMSLY